MKSNYKLKLFTAIVVLGVSLGNAVAFTSTLIQTTTPAENSDNWVLIQNEKGIKVYFSKYQLNGNPNLKIKFENTTNVIVEFSWSLKNKKGETIINEYPYVIQSKTSMKFFGATMPIPFNNGETVKDYSININIQ